MSSIQARFFGGPLDGRTLWIDEGRDVVDIQMAEPNNSMKRILQYQLDGQLLRFVGELEPQPLAAHAPIGAATVEAPALNRDVRAMLKRQAQEGR
jgi:hypothetical protein